MLHRLFIRNYALIDTLDITFSTQLTILTGETGAGKSIILGALSLILGQRAESKYFFNQQKKCVIEGYFQIGNYQLESFFSDNDLDYEQETILRREIALDGKSRAFINDTPVSLGLLRQMGEKLIDIHSQHATQDINQAEFQLFVLDVLADNQALLGRYQCGYKTYQQLVLQLEQTEKARVQAKIDQDYYQFLFDELDQAKLKEGEQVSLEQELDRLTHAEDIKRSLTQAAYLLSEDVHSVTSQLKAVMLHLQQAERHQSSIKSLTERLSSSLIEIKDIAAETDQIEQLTHTDHQRSDIISERLNLIYTLQKKHQVNSVADLLLAKDRLVQKLDAISSFDEEIEKLQTEIHILFDQLKSQAAELNYRREEVIPSLQNQIQTHLSEIGMPNAVLQISNEISSVEKFGPSGCNQIQFLFSANKGQVPLPVHKVASGGELSRLMLSIKSIIARYKALPTIIFDEIDTGISGEVALKVGHVMEKLGQHMQVITITHLPQIASKGKMHYCIYKQDSGVQTHTQIKQLDESGRIVELAKMLSGENPGAHALQHAKELLSAMQEG